MKKLFSLFLALAACTGTIFASNTQVDGIWYNFDNSSMTAEVTYRGPSYTAYTEEYASSLIIPSIVTYNAKTYSVTSIGDLAFFGCTGLTSVTIPNSVTSIGDYAFGYTGLTSPVFNAHVFAYLPTSYSGSYTIPNGIELIAGTAFNSCTGLTSVTIPNSVTSIGRAAFSGCTGLTSIVIPNSVTSIGDWAFSECTNLISATIPNSVTSIGERAFYSCTGLTSVTMPNSVTSIGDFAFSGCTGLTSPVFNAHVFAYLPTSYSGSYTIPNGIELIAGTAFYGCTGLTSVTIPNSVTSIGQGAFYGCTGLTSPVFNAHVFAYLPTSYSGHYSIPEGIEQIGGGAFSGCKSLTSVTIPNSVTSIGRGAFYGCTGLTSVLCLGETPPVLDDMVFYFYHNNDYYVLGNFSIHVPCGALETYQNAEGWSEYASKIKYTPYPSYTINKKAESGYISTTTTDFTICDEPLVICTAKPNRGYQFIRWADGNTDNPRTIELTQDTTMEAIFDYLLEGKCGKDSALTWKFNPSTMALDITGKGALSENYTYGTFIESLTIGNEVTSIGQSAFYGCNNLKNIIIGSSVKVLEEAAFYGCSAIETITCYSQRPPTVNNYALYGLDYSTIVYVPADYLNTYVMHDSWGLYDVRPLGAKSTETTEVTVTPAENTAEVVWPSVSGATTYELVIKDKNGNIICTLVFNTNGQLTSIAFNAPARNNAPQQTQGTGFSFTVTGLDSGTGYDLTITAKDSNGSTLDTQTASFTTTGAQGIDNVSAIHGESTKLLRNGQILILRGDKTYTLDGQEVK